MATGKGFVVGGLNGVSEREGGRVRMFPKAGARALGIQPTAYALSRDGRTVAIGGDDGSVHLLDLIGGEVRTASGHHGGPVNEAIFTPNGRSLVTAGEDGGVILWDVRQATEEQALSGHTRSAFSPQVADDGATLYTADQDGTVLIWDLAGNHRLGQSFAIGKPGDPSGRYALSSDARLLAHGQSDGTVSVVDLRSPAPRERSIAVTDETGVEGRSGIEGMTFVPGTHRLIAGTLYGWAALVDADRSRVLGRLDAGAATYRMGSARFGNPIWTPGVSADGRLLVTATSNGTVKLWSLPDAARAAHAALRPLRRRQRRPTQP